MTPEQRAEMRRQLAVGRCLCSSSTTDWNAVEGLLDALDAAERERDAAHARANDWMGSAGTWQARAEQAAAERAVWFAENSAAQAALGRVRALCDDAEKHSDTYKRSCILTTGKVRDALDGGGT